MIGILTDVTRCIGCWKCVDACAQANKLGPDIRAPQDSGDGLTARRWTTIIELSPKHYVRKQCRHCLEPACVSVCPAAALQKTADGPVIYDSNKCMGCRYCMMACPFGIPRYQWDNAVPLVQKCTLCYQRLQVGQKPACVQACSHQATIFGDRTTLLAEAHKRLQAEPTKYVQTVYGEHEVGGTLVLYISDVPLDSMGYSAPLPVKPMPDLTLPAMMSVSPVGIGMMALMTGTWWIIRRRMKLMGHAADASNSAESANENK